MRRILLTVVYDGSEYHGFQIQENAATIAGELEKALSSLTKERIGLIGGSRTDALVHAVCNRTAFDTESSIEAGRFPGALNAYLPEDIRVTAAREVPADFHPLAAPSEKTYEYRILQTPYPDPLRRRYTYHLRTPLDLDRMNEAAAFFVGEHDFASMCSAKAQVKCTVRTVYECGVTRRGDELVLRIAGNGFLYNMVRIIAGTLVDIGRGFRAPEEIPVILEGRDRQKAGPTAPPQGLCLVKYVFSGLDTDICL